MVEGDEICDLLGLPVISKNEISRGEIHSAIRETNKKKLLDEMKNYSKLKNKEITDYQRQPYLSEKKVVEARTMFRINSGLFPCKVNYQSDPKYSKDLWFCDSCERQIDSMSHVTICPAYKSLREGKNIESDKDLVKYMTAVMQIRTKLGLRK